MNNLPTAREIRNVSLLLIGLQAISNRPTSLRDIMDGLYGSPDDYNEADRQGVCDEIAQILTTCHQLGWITDPYRVLHDPDGHPDGGTIMLTDIGDEKATTLRGAMEAMGLLTDRDIHDIFVQGQFRSAD